MAVIDELAGRENGGDEFHPVDHRVESVFKETDQVLGSVAAPARCLFVITAELALRDIAVISPEQLFSRQLRTEIRDLAATPAVLARTVIADVDGALGPTPQVDAIAPVDFIF